MQAREYQEDHPCDLTKVRQAITHAKQNIGAIQFN